MDIWDLIKVIAGTIAGGYGLWRGFRIGWKKAQKKEEGKDGHSREVGEAETKHHRAE